MGARAAPPHLAIPNQRRRQHLAGRWRPKSDRARSEAESSLGEGVKPPFRCASVAHQSGADRPLACRHPEHGDAGINQGPAKVQPRSNQVSKWVRPGLRERAPRFAVYSSSRAASSPPPASSPAAPAPSSASAASSAPPAPSTSDSSSSRSSRSASRSKSSSRSSYSEE